jgi:ABC-type Zn uptake system ZnuABC Zn-binding protein ZnuA
MEDSRILDASEGVEMLSMTEHGHEHEEGGGSRAEEDTALHEREAGVHGSYAGEDVFESHDGHDHDVSGNDPHIWLDFENAALMSMRIAEAMSDADPAHAALYADRAAGYALRLSELDGSYRDRFAE